MDTKGGAPATPQPPSPPANPNPNRGSAALLVAQASASAPSKPMLAFHFLRALSRIHRAGAAPVPRRTRTIRRAAYSSMALAAGPRRAWSRALLRQAHARRSRPPLPPPSSSRRPAPALVRRRVVAGAAASTPLPAATRSGAAPGGAPPAAVLVPSRQAGEPARADALRRLVPGGAGMEYCSLLDETADYLRFLRAQVQLMQGLVDLFSRQ